MTELIERLRGVRRALLDAMAAGSELHSLTTVDDHVAAPAAGRDTSLGFLV